MPRSCDNDWARRVRAKEFGSKRPRDQQRTAEKGRLTSRHWHTAAIGVRTVSAGRAGAPIFVVPAHLPHLAERMCARHAPVGRNGG